MRFGVIGAGVIGQLRARSVAERKEITLVAVADPNLTAAGQAVAGTGARAVADYRALVEDPSIEAIIVSTPVHMHHEMACAALAAGKDVLCEKPLSNTVEGCRAIYEAARTSGRTLATGFNHRYYPAVKFLKAAVDRGAIGTLDHLRVFGGHDGLANFRADWMYQGRISGGGAMMDVGIHVTDLSRYVAGEVRTVYGMATNRVWNVERSEDNAVAVFRTDANVPIFYQATWTEWRGYGFHVDAYGDLGMVRASYAPMFNLLVTQAKPGGPRKREYKVYPEIIFREKFKGWQTTTYLSFQDELEEFLKFRRGERASLADGWSGVRAVEIANAVYESTSMGEVVVLSRREPA